MQACLRNGNSLPRSLVLKSQTQLVLQQQCLRRWQARRTYANGMNPLEWVREKIAPQSREKETEEEIRAAKKQAAAEGTQSVFDALPSRPAEKKSQQALVESGFGTGKMGKGKGKPQEHKYSTATFRISHRKLNLLANQISGKPIDWAILQMQFSEKRASTRILNMLATAKDHSVRYKHLNRSRLVVSEAWVTKGPSGPDQIDIKGRRRFGIKVRKYSKMTVVLREGKTVEEKKAERRAKILKRIVSPSIMREDMPLRNPGQTWCW